MLRRVLNLVFSRLVITVTLVLLQVFWLFSVFHWLDAYSTWLNGVGWRSASLCAWRLSGRIPPRRSLKSAG